ncbi:hypothetical protein HQ590_07825, partial [bacterium]|nr:hypothetical protein [bacterium]
THLEEMIKGVGNLVGRYGRHLQKASRSLNLRNVARAIDKGLPMMWGMYVHPALDYQITSRSRARLRVTDWDEWVEKLKPARREARRLHIEREGSPHMCLIVGYNERTEEIAISDSWGPDFAERWLTVEEAKALSRNEFYILQW